MPDTATPSAKGFTLMLVLSFQAVVWFAIGLATGHYLWR